MSETDEEDPLFPTLSPEQIREQFNQDLTALGGPPGLAQEMSRLGDRRPTALRSIQRMAAGDTRVSGEIQVIVELLMRARRRAEYESVRLNWQPLPQGGVTTKTREFQITLSPQTRGRWHVNLMHDNGYSPPWPTWQPSLEEAKIRAMLTLEEAIDSLRYNELLEERLKGLPKT